MPPRLRIASISVASAAAIGLCGATGIAPPAHAEPCTGAAAAAQPPAPAARATPGPCAAPTTGGPPVGHRPAREYGAPLPKLGQISRALLNAFNPQSGQVEKQAGVAPPPPPPALRPATAGRRTADPSSSSRSGACTAAGRPARNIARRLGDRTQQPEQHPGTLRHHRNRPRHHVGQRRPANPGADGLRRHLRLLQRPRQSMAVQRADAQPGRRACQHRQRAEGGRQQYSAHLCGRPALSRQIINSTKWAPTRRASFRPQASPSGEPSTSTTCPSEVGMPTARGQRTTRPSPCRLTTASAGASTPDPSARQGECDPERPARSRK